MSATQPELPGMPARPPLSPLSGVQFGPPAPTPSAEEAYDQRYDMFSTEDWGGVHRRNSLTYPSGFRRGYKKIEEEPADVKFPGLQIDKSFDKAREGVEEIFVPTEHLYSDQSHVNTNKVKDHVKHSTGLDQPPILVEEYQDPGGNPEKYAVWNGNHRANAALARGQLFVPAQVLTRYRRS